MAGKHPNTKSVSTSGRRRVALAAATTLLVSCVLTVAPAAGANASAHRARLRPAGAQAGDLSSDRAAALGQLLADLQAGKQFSIEEAAVLRRFAAGQ